NPEAANKLKNYHQHTKNANTSAKKKKTKGAAHNLSAAMLSSSMKLTKKNKKGVLSKLAELEEKESMDNTQKNIKAFSTYSTFLLPLTSTNFEQNCLMELRYKRCLL